MLTAKITRQNDRVCLLIFADGHLIETIPLDTPKQLKAALERYSVQVA